MWFWLHRSCPESSFTTLHFSTRLLTSKTKRQYKISYWRFFSAFLLYSALCHSALFISVLFFLIFCLSVSASRLLSSTCCVICETNFKRNAFLTEKSRKDHFFLCYVTQPCFGLKAILIQKIADAAVYFEKTSKYFVFYGKVHFLFS